MRSITRFLIRVILISTPFFLLGCSEDWALKEETFSIAAENDDWVPPEAEASFLMTDNNGIAQGFIMTREERYLDKSWGGLFGLNTHMTFTEYRSRSYASNYGFTCYSSIRASTWEPYGDELSVSVNDVSFRFDLALEMVTAISTQDCTMSYSQTSEGYGLGEEITSAGELLDTLTVGDSLYHDVLHLVLHDCTEQQDEFTVSEIYYARSAGLVRFDLLNGTVYNLISEQ